MVGSEREAAISKQKAEFLRSPDSKPETAYPSKLYVDKLEELVGIGMPIEIAFRELRDGLLLHGDFEYIWPFAASYSYMRGQTPALNGDPELPQMYPDPFLIELPKPTRPESPSPLSEEKKKQVEALKLKIAAIQLAGRARAAKEKEAEPTYVSEIRRVMWEDDISLETATGKLLLIVKEELTTNALEYDEQIKTAARHLQRLGETNPPSIQLGLRMKREQRVRKVLYSSDEGFEPDQELGEDDNSHFPDEPAS